MGSWTHPARSRSRGARRGPGVHGINRGSGEAFERRHQSAHLHIDREEAREEDDEEELVAVLRTRLQVHAPVPAAVHPSVSVRIPPRSGRETRGRGVLTGRSTRRHRRGPRLCASRCAPRPSSPLQRRTQSRSRRTSLRAARARAVAGWDWDWSYDWIQMLAPEVLLEVGREPRSRCSTARRTRGW